MATLGAEDGDTVRRPATEADRLRYQEPSELAYAAVNAATLGGAAQAAAIALCICGLVAKVPDVAFPLVIFGGVCQLFAFRAFAIAIGRLVVASSRIRARHAGVRGSEEQEAKFIG